MHRLSAPSATSPGAQRSYTTHFRLARMLLLQVPIKLFSTPTGSGRTFIRMYWLGIMDREYPTKNRPEPRPAQAQGQQQAHALYQFCVQGAKEVA